MVLLPLAAAVIWGPSLLVSAFGPTIGARWLERALAAEVEVGEAEGGLWTPLLLRRVVFRRDGETILRAAAVRCDLGLLKLGLTDGPITLDVEAPLLCFDPRHPRELLRALDPLGKGGTASSESDDPVGRPLSVRWEAGGVEVVGTGLHYDLDGQLWTELGVSGSVGYHLALLRGDERIESRGSLGIGSEGGDSGFLGHTTLQSVPIATLRTLLPAFARASVHGTITSADVDVSGDEAGTALTLRMDAVDVVVHGTSADPWGLGDVKLVVRGLFGARRVRLDELALRGAMVRAVLSEPAMIELIDGKLVGGMHGTFHLEEMPPGALPFLPADVRISGPLAGDLDFEGTLGLASDLAVRERLARARADLSLEVQHADLAGWTSGKAKLRLEARDGALHLRELSARMGGGSLLLYGDLPLGAEAEAGGELQWTLDDLALDRRFASGEALWLSGVRGGGVLSRGESSYGLRGALEFDRLDLEGPNLGGGMLSLSGGIADLDAELAGGLDRVTIPLLRVTTAEGGITLEGVRAERRTAAWSIRGQVRGSFEPIVLDRLLPDWRIGAEAPVEVAGSLAIDPGREPRSRVEGELDLRCERVQARDRLLTGVRTRVTKVGSRLELAESLRFQHRGGTVEVGGHWELASPDEGRLEAAVAALPLSAWLPGREEAPPRALSAVLTGQTRASWSARGRALEFEGQVDDLRLREGDRDLATLDTGHCEGRVAIESDASLDVTAFLRGEGLDGAVALERSAQPGGAFDFAGRLTGEGIWLEALAPLFDLEGLGASGPVALRLALSGDARDPLRLEGKAEVAAQTLDLAGQELRDLHVEASLGAGRLRVARGTARSGEGELTLAGECGLLAVARRTQDRLHLELAGFPIRVVDVRADAEGSERITLGTVTGTATVVPDATRSLQASLDLAVDPLTRYLKQRGSIVKSGRLPRLALRGDLSVDGDLEGLCAAELRAEGEGLSCILRDLDLRRGEGQDGVGRVDVEVAAEVARLLLLGYESPHYSVDGPLRLELSAGPDARAGGRAEVDAFTLGGLRGTALTAVFGVAGDRLTVSEATGRLDGGSVQAEPGSFVVLGGEAAGACQLGARLSDVRIARQAGRWLGILIPVLLVDPESVPSSELRGRLDGSIELSSPGGSSGLSGTVSLGLREGFVRGSIVMEALARKLPQVSDRGLVAAIAEGLGHPRALERAVEKAAFEGLRLLPLRIELRIERGELAWQPGTRIPTSWMNLDLQGSAALGGSLDVAITTDLLRRVLNASLDRSPPNELPPARGALRALEGKELRAHLRGDPLARDPDGSLSVHVDVLIAR